MPLPDTLSVSGEALILPDSALDFVRDDLAGFGAAVDEFRSVWASTASRRMPPVSARARPPRPSPVRRHPSDQVQRHRRQSGDGHLHRHHGGPDRGPDHRPATRRIVGFRVKKSKGPGDVLLWDALAGLGPDAVTVSSADQVTDAPEELKDRSGKKLDVLKRAVLTEHGHPLGKVKDVEFDPADGRVTSLLLKDSFIDGGRLLGIGKYAVVVAG